MVLAKQTGTGNVGARFAGRLLDCLRWRFFRLAGATARIAPTWLPR